MAHETASSPRSPDDLTPAWMTPAQQPPAQMTPAQDRLNRWAFGLGSVGRDMVYILVSLFLSYFMSEVLDLSDSALGWVTALTLSARLFDAVMDIVMGGIVDNTRTRWGPYKPWIVGGVLASAILTVLLFSDLKLSDLGYAVFFSVVYLLWGLAWTSNDIPYWALLPSLTLDPKERERIGAVTKLLGTFGIAFCVVGVLPITTALSGRFGRSGAWTMFALIAVSTMVVFQLITVFVVRVPRLVADQPPTTVRELASAVIRNDQLLVVVVSQILVQLSYITTTAFGPYYFKYVYRDESMYSPFGAVLLLAQLLGYGVFPLVARRLKRRHLYLLSVTLVLVGYVAFFVGPVNIVYVGVCGLLVFVGQAWIMLLSLMFIGETIDYGHLKLGRRNQAVTFALMPFIIKVGAALSAAFVNVTLIVSGINSAKIPDDVTSTGLLMLRVAMLVVPAVLTLAGYLIYRFRYTLHEEPYAEVVAELRATNQISD